MEIQKQSRLSVLVLSALGLWVCGCMPTGMFGLNGTGTGSGLQITPSATTVNVDQQTTFQVSGGLAPYQYQVNGVGTIDGSGDYQSGASPGQAQIQVTDSEGNTGFASVSVVQSSYTSTGTTTTYPTTDSYGQMRAHATRGLGVGWSPVSPSSAAQPSAILGPVIAVDDHTLDSGGDVIKSKFIETRLSHPIVRVDKLIEGEKVVALRAVIEDQLVVKLKPGESESALTAILAKDEAHVSRRLSGTRSFLVSMNRATAGQGNTTVLSPDFIAKRTRLKRELQSIAFVLPNVVSRSPASGNN